MALIFGAEPGGLRERAFGVLLTVMLLCVMSPGHVAAEEQEAVAPELKLSLRDAIQAAVDNNVNVRLLKERIAAAQAQTNTSFGALLPNVGGYLTGRHQTVNLAAFGLPADRLSGLGLTRSVTDPFEVYDARATLVQNIFSLSLLQRWRAAKSGLDVAGLEAEVTKRDVMATVGLLYIEILRADEAVKARLNLIRALGIAFDVRLTLTDELKFVPPVTQRVEEALVTAREQRLELRAQETRQRLATLSLSSVTSERIPSLSLNGDYGWVGLKPDEAMTTRSIGLTLSIPIFDGGQREGRISENRSRVRQESIRMKDVSDQVTLEVRNALLTLESSTQQVAVAEKGLELALKELTFAKDRFAAGLVTNIEVTNAQASVARARDNQIEALFRFNASRINLARAKGEIDKLF